MLCIEVSLGGQGFVLENALVVCKNYHFSPPPIQNTKVFFAHQRENVMVSHESMGVSLKLGPRNFYHSTLVDTHSPTVSQLLLKGFKQLLALEASASGKPIFSCDSLYLSIWPIFRVMIYT